MNWSDVKRNLIDLGFESEDIYSSDEEVQSIFITATNRARRIISQVVPLIGRYDFVQSEDKTEYNDRGRVPSEFDLPAVGNIENDLFTADDTGTRFAWNGVKWVNLSLTEIDLEQAAKDESGKVLYDSFDSMQQVKNGMVYPFNDFTIEQGHIVVMSRSIYGEYTIFYRRRIDDITLETQDDFDIQMDYQVEHLVPLLAAHYAWLDDDIQKATMYYNEYEAEINKVIQRMNEKKNAPKMRILNGRSW